MKLYSNELEKVRSKTKLEFEVWKDVKGFEGLYRISSLGRVKSFHYDKVQGRLMTASVGRGGDGAEGSYLFVHLRGKDGKDGYKYIHRLVAEAYHSKSYEPGLVVNHIDHNPRNNYASNLEFITQGANLRKAAARRKKLGIKVEKKPPKRLTEEEWSELIKSYIPNDPEFGQVQLSKKYGISKQTVYNRIRKHREKVQIA